MREETELPNGERLEQVFNQKRFLNLKVKRDIHLVLSLISLIATSYLIFNNPESPIFIVPFLAALISYSKFNSLRHEIKSCYRTT